VKNKTLTKARNFLPVPTAKMIIKGITSGPRAHLLGTAGYTINVGPASLGRFAISLSHARSPVGQKLSLASFDMHSKMKFWHKVVDGLAVLIKLKTNAVAFLGMQIVRYESRDL
jgi:hypothetical protein